MISIRKAKGVLGAFGKLGKIKKIGIVESASPKGYVTVTVKHPDGTTKVLCDRKPNLFTNKGLDFIHDSAYKDTVRRSTPANWIAVSAGTVAPAKTQENLEGEITTGGLKRAQGTVAHMEGSNTTTIEWTFEASAVHNDIHKAALFTQAQDAIGGTTIMTNVEDFQADETLQSGSQLTVKWTIEIG